MDFDASRAMLGQPDDFPRFRVPDRGEPLASAGLKPKESLIIVERGGARRALSLRQVAFHHVAQGELAGEPYAVSF
ncbi:MAG: DUF3179 domain-containing (seleno)protein [Nannocystaceae bacterium]